MSKAIYVAATCFQLITNLNIRCNMHGPEGDLIINAESVPDARGLAERLKKYKLFENIFIFSGYDTSFKSVFNGKNTLYSYLKLVVSKHCGKVNMNDFLEGEKKINLLDYDEVFCFNKRYCDIFISYGIKINIIDEGLGSYIKLYIKNISKVNKFYLYTPNLADYFSKYESKIIRIKPIDPNNLFFKNLLNYIFKYKNINLINKSVIFLDQPYLRNLDILNKISIYFPSIKKIKFINKYFIEEDKLHFTCDVVNCIKKGKKVYIKPHPRDEKYQLEFYNKSGISLFSKITVPWELILLNISEKNVLLLSFDSTATLSLAMYFNCSNIRYKSLLLYKLYFDSRKKLLPERYVRLNEIVNKLNLSGQNVFVVEENEKIEDIVNI